MSKKISYKGKLAIGLEDRIRLKTIKGKVGYKITKFQIIGTAPGTSTFEYVAKITKTSQTGSIDSTVDFTNAELIAVCYYEDTSGSGGSGNVNTVIFDNEVTNQDIFINITDPSGGTTPCNYYIELEAMSLNDLEATQLTLKNIRTITS
jgi:hypothetical protein